MVQERQNLHSIEASRWLFESFTTSQRENNRNLIWVCGAFLFASFLTVAFNLGAIENIAFQALSIEGSLTSTLPIRAMMSVVCFVTFAAIVYVVLEQQRLELGVDYLAKQQQSEAAQIDSFSDWLEQRHPMVSRAKRLSIVAFLTFCAAVLVIDIATLFYSFSI
ncbi:hypothetical protein BCF46_0199 [Litoreibacter meonggei]|uniref:Uncharacterized protein n=1 Tax=Litoreibacter meonggei TaxID=1049199 RepID=A0A497WTG9_9RHOB|nr:hypothetical protein [Litoreibacter meonggei]RLJ60007.1 hypothetical protein BCF46_0199 [Litoreibacter meonggei]